MKPREPIQARIAAALHAAGGCMDYYALMRAVFPPEQFPRAWNYASGGGPAGCAMALGAALRRGGYYVERSQYGGRTIKGVCKPVAIKRSQR